MDGDREKERKKVEIGAPTTGTGKLKKKTTSPTEEEQIGNG